MSLSFRQLSLLGACVLLAVFLPFADPARAAATYIVTKTADTSTTCVSGANCSLREAINAANAAPGAITFAIPTSDPGYQASGGYWRMTLGQRLPALSGGNTSINGLGADGKPKIEINGGGTISGHGLYISSANNSVRGLILNGIIKAPATALTGGGIQISGSAATGNQILQCYIGTNYNGTAAGGAASANNVGGGVLLEDGASTTIIDGNVISGNGGYGIYIYNAFFNNANRQSGNIIRNNYIGVAADGSTALGNQQDGLYIGDNSVNTVVGPNNVISANGPAGSSVVFGVNIGGFLATSSAYINGTRVIGNRIGADASGTLARPNAAGGILITSSDSTTIGGPNGSPATPSGDGNLISGNAGSGIWVKDVPAFGSGTTGISIQNNWIGLNAAGAAALPNAESGVHLSNSANTITVGPNNVISGNTNDGVWIQADPNKNGQPPVAATKQVRQNVITGNSIGTDASGAAAVPNKKYGVRLEGGTFGNTISNNQIRFNLLTGVYLGADTGAPPAMPTTNTISGNHIRANGVTGIALTLGSNNNTIGGATAGAGNTIEGHTSSGVEIQSSGNLLKGNEIKLNQVGILINNAPNNTIGGSTLAEGNILHDNTLHGVFVNGSAAVGNRISHTTTYANGGKGIALSNGGNAPIAAASISVTPPVSGSTLSGTVAGCAAPGCTIEIFTDDNLLDNEGPNFLQTAPLNNITGAFSVDIAGCKHYLIFTLTDSAGNTSEFLSPTGRISQCVPSAPAVQISTANPQPPRGVAPGSSTTYQHTATNSGNAAGSVTVALTQSPTNWATLINNTCVGQSLAPQASCTFDVLVNVPANARSTDFNLATLTVNIGSASAQQQDRTNVLPNPSLTFVPYPNPGSNAKSTGAGQPVTYEHKLTNTGNGPDSFTITVAPPAGWAYSVQPAAVNNLAPNAFAIVTVVLTPTAGADPGDYAATVTARSVANANVTAAVVDTTTITAAAVPQISVTSVTPSSVDPGATVTISYTVTNAGNQAGTFNLAFAGPAGWSITQPVSPSVTLAKGASVVVSATLQAPAGAFAGPYPATLTATDQAAPTITASATATINVKQKAALTLGADFNDPTQYAPNQVVTYTTQLQNNGNFTDTISLAATASRGWPVQIAPTVTLAPGAIQLLQIGLSIPPGQLVSPPNVTTITATSSLQVIPLVRATTRITTTLAAVSGALLQPPTQTQSVLANRAITYTFTLRNSGSLPQSYNLSTANVPAGWQSTLAPTQTQTLQPNQTLSVTLGLKVPAGLADGQVFNVNLIAACRENACSPASATAVVRLGPPIQVGGACDQAVLPGTTVTCRHTITNTGSVSDTFEISLLSYLNWSTTLSPQVVILGPNSSTTFTATLLVPTSAPAGAIETLNITARSTGSPSIAQRITDTITVLQFGRVSFTPSQVRPPTPGQPITFIHTLTNIGNGLDSFVITATQDLNWKITITPTQTTTLAPGINYPVTVQVEVPASATSRSLNRITVRAISVHSPSAQAVLTDLVGVTNAPSNPVYLPFISQ